MNSRPSHTPMPCAILPQFTNFPLVKSTVLPCNCTGLRSNLEFGCRPPSCGLGATVGWEGCQNFFQICEGRCILQPEALTAPLEPHSGAARGRGVVETCSLLPQALCRQSFVAVGAAFWCWLGTWLYMQHSSAAVGLVPMTPGDVACAKGTTLEPHSVVSDVRTGWWRLVLHCLRPCVDSPSSQWGQHSGAG